MAGTNLPRVPEGLRDLMKAYTKEVLREKPTNLYEFSSDYFERIAGGRVHYKVLKYEPPQSYETIMKNRIRQQVPISMVFNIIPDSLTELIKKFIKSVLREKPENLLVFAVEYFQRLRNTHSPRMEYTKYSAYEKYSEEKGSSFASQEKCACGRILSSKTRELETAIEDREKPKESTESTHSVQYLKAVCIIQKQVRKYLKEKREKNKKLNSVSSEIHKSQEHMIAISLIQRQFRRYLSKKRAEKAVELAGRENRYDSVEYMNAIRIIQRFCRQYLRKRVSKPQLNVNKTTSTERKLSVTTAAFIIQRAFKNMVKTRRAKRHVNAELDQGDEVNDNASEAASYTSASTALLSTQSTYEHIELGGSNYDEGVHQQTIREDEEVENDNTNNFQGEFITKDSKSKGKSIHSDGDDLDINKMDNRKKRGLYGQKSRRDIHSEPNYDKPITSSENSEDFPSETENIKNSMLNIDSISSLAIEADDKKAIEEEETIQKRVSHLDSMETSASSQPKDQENPSLEKDVSNSDSLVAENQLKLIENSIINVEDKNESNIEKSIEESISKAGSLKEDVQSDELEREPSSENPDLPNKIKNSEEPIVKSTSQLQDLDSVLQSDELERTPSSESTDLSVQIKDSEKSIVKNTSELENLETALQSDEVTSLTKSQRPSEENFVNVNHSIVEPSLDTALVISDSLQAVLSEGDNDNNSARTNLKQSSTPSVSIEDKPTTAEDNQFKSMENNEDAQEITAVITDESDNPNTENDYSVEVNSLQTLLGTMKENNKQDGAIIDIEESSKLSPTDKGSLEIETGSMPKTDSDSKDETKDPMITEAVSSTPKIKSADSASESKEPENAITNITNSEAGNANERTSSNNTRDSITIHSVLPGEDDYELPLSSDVPLSSDNASNVTDSAQLNITENTKANESIEKSTTDEHKLKQDSSDMSDKQSDDKLEVSKPTKESSQDIDGDSTKLDLSLKETEEAVAKENIKQLEIQSSQKAEGDLDDNGLSEVKKMIDKQSSEHIENISTELENSEAQISKPSEEESNESITKELIANSESTDTNTDISPENNINLKNISFLKENTETGSDENSEDVIKKIFDSEQKTPAELAKDVAKIVDETIDKTIDKRSVESDEITNDSPIPAQQNIRKNVELEEDIINTNSDGDSKETVDERTNDEDQAEKKPQDPEKLEKDAVTLSKSDESRELSEDSYNTKEAQEKPLTSSSEDYTHDKINVLSGVAVESPMIAVVDQITRDEAEEKYDNSSEAPLSDGTEEILKNYVSEESQDKIRDIQSNDDKDQDKLESTILDETPMIASSDETNKENVKEVAEEIVKDNTQTTSAEGNPILEEDKLQSFLKSSLSKETADKDKILTTSTESNPNLEEDINKESLKSSLSKETDDKDKDKTNIALSEESAERSLSTDNDVTDLTENTLILNNKTISAELSKSKSVNAENEEGILTDVKTVPDKDVDSEDVSKSNPVKTQESIAEDSNLKAEINKNNEAKPDSLNTENKSSLPLSNQLVDTQIKKMPIVKDKHLTSFTSGRLTNAPVAELQLKSFRTDADGGHWYDIYTEPADNSQADDSRLERHQSVEMPERRPNYVYGEEPTSQETVKPKQSIAFFISFDGDDGKTSFKIPKRFLRQSESNRKTAKSQILTMDPIIPADEDLIESDDDIGYQQFGVQKLQTIHELNENESSNELKSLMDKTDDNVKDIYDQDISMDDKIDAEPIAEGADLTQDRVENILSINENEINLVKDNELDQSNELKRKRSAQIIQKAYKNYKARQGASSYKDIDDLKLSNKLDEDAAATRIQKAIRYFLTRIAKNKKDTASLQNREYTNVEILAAVRIQNMFRNYIRRKKESNLENLSKATSATSLITVIPNTNDSHTPEVSLHDGEASEEITMMNSELISSKPEWFVGTQRISLESPRSPLSTSGTDTIGITESTDNIQIESDTKLATDIGNIVNELSASEVFAQDNGASNNLAGSANETLEDLAIEAFGELDVSFKDTSTRQLLNEFLISEIEFSSIQKPYPESQDKTMLEEVQEDKCIKKSVSLSNLTENETKDNTEIETEETQLDAMDEATSKLMKPDEVIEKMSQRRSAEKRKEDFQVSEPSFDEPVIRSMSALQEQSSLDIEDGDIIVYNRLQRDETRESSAQSESVVFGNDNDDDKVLGHDNTTETARSQLARHYTIAGEDPRVIFRSVTIDETVRYIENENEIENEDMDNGINNSMSFCLDDETSENIRKKMMAYSLSEGDSDYFDPSKIVQDDSQIDTAMTDAMDTSTETESTIVSAATKIQAGARGFLARRRLRRASAGTNTSTQDTKASFGNDAISESLERFIEEEAAKKIQVAYRLHSRKQKKQTNNLKSASLESSLAAKRQTLQRGDALRNDSNSTPEDENGSTTSAGQTPKAVETKLGKDNVTRSKRSSEYGLKWPAVRQNSMPVQIDCEFLRPIPKHMRRRIRSAENDKKKNRK